jgi:hypothetical protein
MIIPTILGFLVIFSIASIVLSSDEPPRDTPTRPDQLPFWVRYGHR